MLNACASAISASSSHAIGTATDNRLGIPGEDRPGSHPATEFVAWYNGHPHFADQQFDLNGGRAVVIGNGNVAIDVARMLVLDPAELALYDELVAVEAAANDRLVRGDYEGALKSLVAIKPHLDLFFDKVMVMVEDETLKRQRLAVLAKLVRAFKRVADLSEIQASSS